MTDIVSKPNAGSVIAKEGIVSPEYQKFFDDLEDAANRPTLKAFTVAQLNATTGNLQASANQDVMVMVTDEAAGRVPAYSNGTNWKKISNDANITT